MATPASGSDAGGMFVLDRPPADQQSVAWARRGRAPMPASHVSVRLEGGGTIEVVDAALGHWAVRFEPIDEDAVPPSSHRLAVVRLGADLIGAIPELADVPGRCALRAVFSPEARAAIADGTYAVLCDRADSAFPVALASGVATAAAIAQQRWWERAFADLPERLDAFDARLHDDDLGLLDAADHLLQVLGAVSTGRVPEQLAHELAGTRRAVDRVYFSRRRSVERLELAMASEPTAHVLRLLDGTGVLDEVVVFVRALVTRARVGSTTAGVLAATGAPVAALQLLDDLEDSVRQDFVHLQAPLAALTRSLPDVASLRALGWTDAPTIVGRIGTLSAALTGAIGQGLLVRDELLELRIPGPVPEATRAVVDEPDAYLSFKLPA